MKRSRRVPVSIGLLLASYICFAVIMYVLLLGCSVYRQNECSQKSESAVAGIVSISSGHDEIVNSLV